MLKPLEYMTDGKGNLCGAVFAGLPCACAIAGDGTLPHPLKIKYCPKHAAAPELLAACVYAEECSRKCPDKVTHAQARAKCKRMLKAAIAKATT